KKPAWCLHEPAQNNVCNEHWGPVTDHFLNSSVNYYQSNLSRLASRTDKEYPQQGEPTWSPMWVRKRWSIG
ncbi:hypothetical protein JYU34_001454, partial [Plutella xylostella]